MPWNYKLFYALPQDAGEKAKALLADIPKCDMWFFLPIPESLPQGALVSFSGVPRPSFNDDLGKITFRIVGPPEVKYDCVNLSGECYIRGELIDTNLSPTDFEHFLELIFKRTHGLTPEEIREIYTR